jgi:small subunit ribosomal protein S1
MSDETHNKSIEETGAGAETTSEPAGESAAQNTESPESAATEEAGAAEAITNASETNEESAPAAESGPTTAETPVDEATAVESATAPAMPDDQPPEVETATAPEPAPATESAPAPVEPPAPAKPPAPVEPPPPEVPAEPQESFGDLLRDYERTHTHRAASNRLEGTVVSVSADQVILDVGYKMEGVLPRSSFENNADGVKPGDRFPVSITGRNEENYYVLSRFKVAQPRDWSALERAFAEKTAVAGTVTAVIKGGLSVDVGVRAFMPASRSGTREASELEALVGQEITCRITKLDTADEDVVVDRRVVLEEQARAELEGQRAALNEGEIVTGTVRTIMPYGAFVTIGGAEIGGIDGLLHVSDISRTRVSKPEDVLTVGQELTLKILRIDPETKKISLGLKQLQPEPWETAVERFPVGARVAGTVTRLMDFGAFVEIEPGLEGLVHISEMSWAKKVRHPSDLLKEGDRVDAVILSVKPEEKRIALGLKQTLADPWVEAQRQFPAGTQVSGTVTKIMAFGAFIEIAEGVEGMVHISEIVPDRRLSHPSDVLRAGQKVEALVLAFDAEKRQIKLSMKQLIPTSIDEYISEHKPGDTVSGRVVEVAGSTLQVDLGEGIRARGRVGKAVAAKSAAPEVAPGKPDLSQLSSMLKARWKGNAPAQESKTEPLAEGQLRSFKIVKLDAEKKSIEVELA